MTELSDRIKGTVDGAARPISLEEATSRRFAKRHGARRIVTILALVAVVATAAGLARLSGSDRPDPSVTAPAEDEGERSAARTTQDGWVPGRTTTGGVTVVPITFPGGTTADLTYTSSAGLLDDLASSSTWNVGCERDGQGCGTSDFSANHGDRADLYPDEPTQTFTTGDGRTVELHGGPPPDGDLVYQMGSWTVAVHTSSINQQNIQLWADNLSGKDADTGYVLIDIAAPLFRLAEQGAPGPAVQFFKDTNLIRLSLGACPSSGEAPPRPLGEGPQWFAGSCAANNNVRISIQGERSFVQTVLDSIDVRDLTPAGTPGPGG